MASLDINLDFKFVNPIQEEFFYCNKRNQAFNGSFGNGKSFGASMKAVTLLATFPFYRFGISRYSGKDLKESTMETFFKCCPPELYNEAYGGRRNDREGYLRFINGSEVLWMHLDDYSETDLRGKEFNSLITDQAEEIAENIWTTLDARMERWDKVQIPSHLNPERFPINPFTKKPMPPCYNMLIFNPDTTLHWIYRKFHPDSDSIEVDCGPIESKNVVDEFTGAWYFKNHAWFTASIHNNPAIPETLKQAMLKREQSWVDRFYWGKWGIAGGSIHYVNESSILTFDRAENREPLWKLLEIIKRDGIKYRVMDHGEGAPTCVLWFAWLSASTLKRAYNIESKGIHICYREYYQPGKIIKYHREAIAAMSGDEKYSGDFADPAIFKKTSQKYGGFWSTADDYIDNTDYRPEEITRAPAIVWQPADNNEMACRDAVHELLQMDDYHIHPITGANPAPAIYFIKKHHMYPNGCANVIGQTMGAKRKKIGSINGEDIYSDERDATPDHAYDPLRYYAIMPKTLELPDAPREAPQFSFNRHLQNRRRSRSYGF